MSTTLLIMGGVIYLWIPADAVMTVLVKMYRFEISRT